MRGKIKAPFMLLLSLLRFRKGEEATKMLENKFQAMLIQKIKNIFPGCIVMKNDSSYIQGIPDLLILHNDKWASLECKKTANAKKQPNQEYYVGRMNEMSFSRFICPENMEEVLDELRESFQA
jgi:hypothetical protein